MATAAVHDVSREPRDPGGRWTVGGQHESWPDYPTFQQTWDAAVRDPRRASTSDLGRALMYGSSILGSLSRQIRAGNQQYMPAYKAFEGEFSTLQDAMRDRKWSEPGPYEPSDEPADEDYESNLMVEEGHVTPPWLQEVMDEYSKRGAVIKYAEDEDRREDDVPLHKGPHWVNLDGARALVDENGQILKACKGLKGYNLDELDETAEERSDKQEAAEDAGWESAETKRARDTWTRAKKQAPEAVVVVRSGDKFFAFNADAKQLQALSQLGNGETAQFDAEKLEHHIGQLIEGGHRVAVVDRTESGEPDFSSEADKETQQAVANAELSDQDVLALVQKSPQMQGLERDWNRYAERWGVKGQTFRRVDLPVSQLAELNRSGRLMLSTHVSRGDIEAKKASGARNPVIVTKHSNGGRYPLAVIDGTHSLHAAVEAGDATIPVIIGENAAEYLGLGKEAAAAKPEGENPQKPQHGEAGFAQHVAAQVSNGQAIPDGADQLLSDMAQEAIAGNENISKTMRRHGLDPVKDRGFRAALADEVGKQKEAAKPKPSEARQRAMQRQLELQGQAAQPAAADPQKAFFASPQAEQLFLQLNDSNPEFQQAVQEATAHPDLDKSPAGQRVNQMLLDAARKAGMEVPASPGAPPQVATVDVATRHASTGQQIGAAPRVLQRLLASMHGLRDTRKTGQSATKDIGADYAKGMYDYMQGISKTGDGFGDVYDLSKELGHGAIGYASPAGNVVLVPPMMKSDDWDVRYSLATPTAAPTAQASPPATPQPAPTPPAPTPPAPTPPAAPQAATTTPPPVAPPRKKRNTPELSPKAKLDQAIKEALGNWTTPHYRQEFRKALDEAWEEKRQEIEGRNRAVDRVLGNFGYSGQDRTTFFNEFNRKDRRGNYIYDDHDSFRKNSSYGRAFDEMADFAERYTPEILQGYSGMTAEDALFDRLRRGAKEVVPPKHDDQFIQAAFAKMGEGPGYEGEDDEKARQIANDPEWQEIMARPFSRDGWKMRYEKWAKQKLSRWRKYARQLAFTFDEESHPRAKEPVTIGMETYRPGEWIPKDQLALATPAEAAKIEGMSAKEDVWGTLEQEYSSACTSIPQVPAVMKIIPAQQGAINADIGGGKFDHGTKFLAERGVTNLVYDPFNRSIEHNQAVLQQIQGGKADTATVANVLNVIKEPQAREGVIRQAAAAIKPNGTAYFQVYEGNRSGVGGQTPKGWQNHRKTTEYVAEVQKYFGDVKRKGNVIYASQPIKAAKRTSPEDTETTGDVGGPDKLPVTETPEFKTWFGDSKVVDAEGKPLVVYHGTKSGFDAFDPATKGRRDLGYYGSGFYFSSSPISAEMYSGMWDRDPTGANIVPAYLKLENPYVADVSTASGKYSHLPGAEATKAMIADGYDGAIITAGSSLTEYVVFSPTQIKSATGNRSTFDPKDPRITYDKEGDHKLTWPDIRDAYEDWYGVPAPFEWYSSLPPRHSNQYASLRADVLRYVKQHHPQFYAKQMLFDFEEAHPRATETVTIEGTQYRPGEWIPAEQAAQATPAEAAKIEDVPEPMAPVAATPLEPGSNEDLAARTHGGERPAAEQLIKNNIGFVKKLALPYARNQDELADLMQEGSIALLSAANDFDPSRRLKFTTFAFYPVREAISKAAKAMHRGGVQLVSDEDQTSAMEQVPEEVQTQRWSPEVLDKLGKAVAGLPERDAQILSLKFGFGGNEPMDYRQIGEMLGVSKQYVHKVATAAMQVLTEKMARAMQHARLRANVLRYVRTHYPHHRN